MGTMDLLAGLADLAKIEPLGPDMGGTSARVVSLADFRARRTHRSPAPDVPPAPLPQSRPSELSPRQAEHRRRMLRHLWNLKG